MADFNLLFDKFVDLAGKALKEKDTIFRVKIHSTTQHLATEEVGDILGVGDTPTDCEKGNECILLFS